jgi:hypothetical protein
MTVAELMSALRYYEKADPTLLVTIDTLGFHRGLFPVADHLDIADGITIEGEDYGCLVLRPQSWPP